MPHDHMGSSPGKLSPSDAVQVTGRVTWFAVGVAGLLALVKLAAFIVTGSIALLASLADSGLDLVAALATFFAVRYAATPADEEHRFGHGKAEAFAAMFQAGLVLLSATLVAREAVSRLIEPAPITQGYWALAAMALSVVVTAALIYAQTHAVRKTGSIAVTGDRAHFSSDIAANLVVIAGIGLAMLGLRWADPVVGFAVAAWLVWSAWSVAQGALDQMMDRELPDEERDHIYDLATADDRVMGVHMLRTRAAGPLVHIQFHVDLPPAMSLDEAHQVMVAMERRILEVYPGADILIHPDPRGRAEPHGNPHLRTEAAE